MNENEQDEDPDDRIDRRRFNRGRPPLVEGEETVRITIRLAKSQRAKLGRIGGAERFRQWLDRVKE